MPVLENAVTSILAKVVFIVRAAVICVKPSFCVLECDTA